MVNQLHLDAVKVAAARKSLDDAAAAIKYKSDRAEQLTPLHGSARHAVLGRSKRNYYMERSRCKGKDRSPKTIGG